ncbi:putative toxin-antitoxin system toxin component, PIN family [Thiothrix subterranea]|uniref:putative toxin-antitoxin system toxin component, PIN family n=1 Tax=Thiothrix subterranea TaxID=2735563 RepID=UPI00192ABD34|nr:putative toxin-antitoxin system toxin component, PIN family [Thiothrix subterranea]QQZ30453.1 putative toxin-antitoxin system toxin component, PIN family [Thiothrix subterranea]
MITAVIDTNVFISALMKADTAPRALLRRCLLGQVQPLIGNALYSEYEDIMTREHVFTTSAVTADERETLFNAFVSQCQWVNIYYRWRPNLRDEADNHLMELAIAGNAQWLITGNTRDFWQHELQFPDIRIATVTEFLQTLQEAN